ncbi:unnamed protein product [Thelazia callipaeda]|uniref:C2H2-type domain-containing protein n=1 Tax=Thelazia callipaeda TaxID=103827 RepID=A0A0N5CZ07_THECL|nr:unnamed protein product [Thelazia callipaeda]
MDSIEQSESFGMMPFRDRTNGSELVQKNTVHINTADRRWKLGFYRDEPSAFKPYNHGTYQLSPPQSYSVTHQEESPPRLEVGFNHAESSAFKPYKGQTQQKTTLTHRAVQEESLHDYRIIPHSVEAPCPSNRSLWHPLDTSSISDHSFVIKQNFEQPAVRDPPTHLAPHLENNRADQNLQLQHEVNVGAPRPMNMWRPWSERQEEFVGANSSANENSQEQIGLIELQESSDVYLFTDRTNSWEVVESYTVHPDTVLMDSTNKPFKLHLPEEDLMDWESSGSNDLNSCEDPRDQTEPLNLMQLAGNKSHSSDATSSFDIQIFPAPDATSNPPNIQFATLSISDLISSNSNQSQHYESTTSPYQTSSVETSTRNRTVQHEFSCDLCTLSFKTPRALTSHKASHKRILHKCHICNREFAYPGYFRTHMDTHEKANTTPK